MVWKGKSAEGETEREKFANEAMEHLDHLYRVAFHLAKEAFGTERFVLVERGGQPPPVGLTESSLFDEP